MEIEVNAPPPFLPGEKTAAPAAAPAPAEEQPGTAWERYWTDEQGARIIAQARHTAATVLGDRSLEPDKLTLELAGPPLAACARALPVGDLTGKVGGHSAQWAIAGLILILALAVGIPIILAMRKRANRKAAEATARQQTEAPPEDQDQGQDGIWRARPRTVGTGRL